MFLKILRKNLLVRVLTWIMIVVMTLSILSCVMSINRISRQNSEKESHVISSMVSNAIENSFLRPIIVSETMCQDYSLKKYLLTSGEVSPTEPEEEVASFLRSILEGFGYQMVFAVCDKSRAYYTYDGISKYVDPDKDDHDIWYKYFVDSGKHYDLDVDTDEANNWQLSVFVNTTIQDDEGNFLGVVGVGVEMVELQQLLADYEKEYNIKIDLIDETGLIQIDTDGSKIERDYLDLTIEQPLQDNQFYYENLGDISRVTTYLDELGWYLVVQDNNPNKIDVLQVVTPSILIFLIGILIMAVTFYIMSKREAGLQEKTSKLDSANTAKSLFLARMSHEIRTPINAVIGNAELILQGTREDLTKDFASDIYAAAKNLLSIINDILDITKIEEGKLSIIPVEYKLSEMLRDVINLIKYKVEAKNLIFRYHIDERIPEHLFGDDIRIRQIMINILSNAAKYTEKGSVDLYVDLISQTEQEILLQVRVKDTGIGIKEEDLDKICKPFERLEEKRNRSIEGTGLGMGITSQLLHMMDSQINIESVYGEGSTFSFQIRQEIIDEAPIGDFESKMKSRSYIQEPGHDFTAKEARILVVDDNEINLKVISNLLKKIQVNVTTCTKGRDCLELVKEQYYDIIFLDHMMPDMDGIETLQAMRAMTNYPCEHSKIVALTANAITGAKEMYLAAGFDDFLTKPIFSEKLYQFIRDNIREELITEGEAVTEHTETNAETNAEMPKLPMINGLDWNLAQLHFDDQETMLDTLRMFANHAEAEYQELSSYFAEISSEQGLSSYLTKVHSMKSSALLLGIYTLGGVAKILEDAARTEKVEVIRQFTPMFLESWLEFQAEIKLLTQEEEDEGKPLATEHREVISKLFDQMVEAADILDIDELDRTMAALEQYRYEENIKQLLGKLKVSVEQFDVDRVKAIITEELKW